VGGRRRSVSLYAAPELRDQCASGAGPVTRSSAATYSGRDRRSETHDLGPRWAQRVDRGITRRYPPTQLPWVARSAARDNTSPADLGVKGSQVQILSARPIEIGPLGLVTPLFAQLVDDHSHFDHVGIAPTQPPPGRKRALPASASAAVSGCRYRAVTAGSWRPTTRCNTYNGTPLSVLRRRCRARMS
jgi:hypothetical protein